MNEPTKANATKAMQLTTGTVHYASAQTLRDGRTVMVPKCGRIRRGTRYHPQPVADDVPVTCAKCLAS